MRLNGIVRMDFGQMGQWIDEIPHGIGKRIWSHYTFRVTGLENKGDMNSGGNINEYDVAFLMGTNNDLYFWAHQDWLIEVKEQGT